MDVERYKSTFPSPLGDLYFSITKWCNTWDGVTSGFRPLSGVSISQFAWEFIVHSGTYEISVPSRGSLFLNKHPRRRNLIWDSGFRPLSGVSISQYRVNFSGAKLDHTFPSPLGGLYFSMRLSTQPRRTSTTPSSFRPLSGVSISQSLLLSLPIESTR